MGRKKKPQPVSLAEVKAGLPPVAASAETLAANAFAHRRRGPGADQRLAAENALSRFGCLGAARSDGPTPERLLHSAGFAQVDRFHTNEIVVEVNRQTGEITEREEEVEHVRVRVDDDQFSRICKRKMVDREPKRNFALCQAGFRYRDFWRASGLDRVKSIDFTADRVQGGGGGGLWASEAQASAFQSYRRAKEAIPFDYREGLEGIILHDRNAADVGAQVGAYRDQTAASAVAMFVLKKGLKALALHLRLIEPDPEVMTTGSVEAGVG